MGDWSQLLSHSNEVRAEFLLVDLETALTFLDVARNSRNPETAERNRHHARKAYDTVLHLLPGVTLGPAQALQVRDLLSELRSRLAAEAGGRL